MDVLDIVTNCEAEAQARRLEEYRAISLNQVQLLCLPGGLSCGVEAEGSDVREMDLRIYGRLCQKLSSECVAVQ
jgi:hypothetical protein